MADDRSWVRLSFQGPGETSDTATWVTTCPVNGSLRAAIDEAARILIESLAESAAQKWRRP